MTMRINVRKSESPLRDPKRSPCSLNSAFFMYSSTRRVVVVTLSLASHPNLRYDAHDSFAVMRLPT